MASFVGDPECQRFETLRVSHSLSKYSTAVNLAGRSESPSFSFLLEAPPVAYPGIV